jgi:hypothetical protein
MGVSIERAVVVPQVAVISFLKFTLNFSGLAFALEATEDGLILW